MRMLKNCGVWLFPLILVATSDTMLFSRSTGGTAPRTPTQVPTQPTVSPTVPMQPTATPTVPVSPTPTPTIAQKQPARTIPLIKKHERFTQTQAYFQVPKLTKLVLDKFHSDFEPVQHMDLVSRVMAKEAELRDTHWAFYHGTFNTWSVWQDTYTELFNHFNPSLAQEGDADFIFLRSRGKANVKAQDFLVGTLKEHGLVDDRGETAALLLSVHLSLFGGTSFSGESTWKYVMQQKSHRSPTRESYESVMDEFGVSQQYIDELMKLQDFIDTKQQTLLQIFVPKSIVDDISYLAWTAGIPAHQGSIDWVKNSKIKATKDSSSAVNAITALKDTFKNEQEKNPLFKEMLEVAEKGGFSVDDYLTRYCNKPEGLSNMDEVQARLIFTDDILLNPVSGVRMFRHTAMKHDTAKEYKERLRKIIKQIVATKK